MEISRERDIYWVWEVLAIASGAIAIATGATAILPLLSLLGEPFNFGRPSWNDERDLIVIALIGVALALTINAAVLVHILALRLDPHLEDKQSDLFVLSLIASVPVLAWLVGFDENLIVLAFAASLGVVAALPMWCSSSPFSDRLITYIAAIVGVPLVWIALLAILDWRLDPYLLEAFGIYALVGCGLAISSLPVYAIAPLKRSDWKSLLVAATLVLVFSIWFNLRLAGERWEWCYGEIGREHGVCLIA